MLRDTLNKLVYVYLDNILIFSPDEVTHVRHVYHGFYCLLQNQLFVKAEECEFHVATISFLGLEISEGKVLTDHTKILAVAEWPGIGLRNGLTRNSCRGSWVMAIFTDLFGTSALSCSSSRSHLLWGTFSVELLSWSFIPKTLFKKRFTSAPILILSDPRRQFVVEVDTSDIGLGAVLSWC